jgi:16S rRNA (cytidine1402-2'-O)-methyltransferase
LHEHNEQKKGKALIGRLQNNESIALVSDAGTPTVSDPGAHLISQAITEGIKVEAVPGPSAVLAALSVSGLLAEGFVFLGFPPTKAKDRKMWMQRLRSARTTAVFYEAPHRIMRTLGEIQTDIGDIRVMVGRELTKVHEELVRGPISVVLSSGFTVKGEFTVVADVGHVTEVGESVSDSVDRQASLVQEFGLMTSSQMLTRRQAISTLAQKYGLSSREAYQAVEDAKKSGS